MDQDDTNEEIKYRVESIEKAEPPAGMQGGSWYHYVVGQGSSQIKCTRNGSLKSVTQYAEEFAENLNTRVTKGYSPYAARKPKK